MGIMKHRVRHEHSAAGFHATKVLACLLGVSLMGGIALAATLDWMAVAFIPVAFYVHCVAWSMFSANYCQSFNPDVAASYRSLPRHWSEHLGRHPAVIWIATQTANAVVFTSFPVFLPLPADIRSTAHRFLRHVLDTLASRFFAQCFRSLLALLELPDHSRRPSILLATTRLLRAPPLTS